MLVRQKATFHFGQSSSSNVSGQLACQVLGQTVPLTSPSSSNWEAQLSCLFRVSSGELDRNLISRQKRTPQVMLN